MGVTAVEKSQSLLAVRVLYTANTAMADGDDLFYQEIHQFLLLLLLVKLEKAVFSLGKGFQFKYKVFISCQ